MDPGDSQHTSVGHSVSAGAGDSQQQGQHQVGPLGSGAALMHWDTIAQPSLPPSPVALTLCPSCCGAGAAPCPGLGTQAALASCSQVSPSGLDWDTVNEWGDLMVLVHPARAQEQGGVSTTSEMQQQQPLPAKRASPGVPVQ